MYRKLVLGWILIGMGCLFVNTIHAEDIQSTRLSSCDQAEDIAKTIFIQAGKESEICLKFTTAAENPISIKYSFINKNPDAIGEMVCAVSQDPTNMFNKIFPETWERNIVVSKEKPTIVKEKIRAPLWANWSVVWCVIYTTQSVAENSIGGMLDLIVRKVFPLSFFVGSGEAIKNNIEILPNKWGVYTTNSKIKATVSEENHLNLDFLIKNNGNVNQNIVITGKVYNFLGFEKEFSIEKEIVPWASTNLINDVWLLPWYKWLFSIKYIIKNEPRFDFDVSSIDEKYKKWWYVSGDAKVYIFSWITLIVFIVIILILLKLFWPRKKIQQQIVA